MLFRSAGSTIAEDDYYNHPTVREYELKKAEEQARWHQRVMRERESAQMRKGVPISASLDSSSSWMHQAMGSSPPGYHHQRGW